jgi:excisionase family DNA binding protein
MRGWLKPKAAAAYCDIGERTLRKWLKEDGLRSSRIGGTILIKILWLDEFLSQREVKRNNELETIVDGVMRDLQ